jgi:hypothetical protein
VALRKYLLPDGRFLLAGIVDESTAESKPTGSDSVLLKLDSRGHSHTLAQAEVFYS